MRNLPFIPCIIAGAFLIAPAVSSAQQTTPAAKKTVKVAMVQMNVVANDVDANLAAAEKLVAQAAAKGAQVAILPECMDIGWTNPGSLTNASAIPGGKVFTRLSQIAAKYKIYVCSGMTERDGAKVYNAAVLIDDAGNLVLKHRKIAELDIGKAYYSTGDRLNVADTKLGRIGVMICADASTGDHSIPTALARMEPNIILSPCAWAVPPGYDNEKEHYGGTWTNAYIPVAKKFGVYIIGVSNVGKMTDGPWKNWDCIGASMAVDNKGNVMLQCPFGLNAETVAYVDCVF
jgi:predicted amidohydrolase